ncbi:MAG: proton-translocating NADH-quinone oxidoreductase, chain [Frankiales bacterium]|jgi:NADH-quinone oxidoreductase subunit M|nr:proton-translocating NADH-quinone oxidoreductase, chain [Frankiales bacterium]
METTSQFPWLTVLGLIPLVGTVVLLALPRRKEQLQKVVALATSLVVLVATILACAAFDPTGDRFQFTQAYDWIPAFGVQYAVGADGIALVLIALIAVLVPVVILASWHDTDTVVPAAATTSVEPDVDGGGAGSTRIGSPHEAPRSKRRSVKAFFALLLVLETMMIGVFAATDVFLFYVFFEAMLIPMYFLIGSYGGPRRSYAAMKFLLFSLAGGLLMLASVIGLYVVSADQGEGTFAFERLVELEISTPVQIALFLGFFIAFAIKAPLFPFHTWLPDAGAEAPVGGAVLLVGVLDKVGTFGFLRYCLPLFPDASRILGPYIIVLCVIGILYGALVAMGQKDLKRLISYTSVAHFGFIGMGIFAFTTQGQTGAVLYMVNHGLSTGALFLVAGFLIARGKSRLIEDYSGVAAIAPILAGTFLLAGLSSLALPGLSTFISEFLVLLGTYSRYPVAAVFAVLGVVLAALYILLTYQRTMQGKLRLPAGLTSIKDLHLREVLAVAPLLALMIVLGVYPKPLTDVINPAVDATMQDAGRTDPAPTQGGGDAAAPAR